MPRVLGCRAAIFGTFRAHRSRDTKTGHRSREAALRRTRQRAPLPECRIRRTRPGAAHTARPARGGNVSRRPRWNGTISERHPIAGIADAAQRCRKPLPVNMRVGDKHGGSNWADALPASTTAHISGLGRCAPGQYYRTPRDANASADPWRFARGSGKCWYCGRAGVREMLVLRPRGRTCACLYYRPGVSHHTASMARERIARGCRRAALCRARAAARAHGNERWLMTIGNYPST